MTDHNHSWQESMPYIGYFPGFLDALEAIAILQRLKMSFRVEPRVYMILCNACYHIWHGLDLPGHAYMEMRTRGWVLSSVLHHDS